jgi:hypothetical protein
MRKRLLGCAGYFRYPVLATMVIRSENETGTVMSLEKV